MSVEIEVGLENAAKVGVVPEEFLLDEPPKGLKNPTVRRLLAVGGLVLLAVVAGLFAYYQHLENTDNAHDQELITSISAKIHRHGAEVLATHNEIVDAGPR